MWHSLVPIWTVTLGLGVFIYVALDGFDLDVGMLHGLVQPSQRETVMTSIGPFWDGNETWLILGGVGLLAAFPVAFAIIIPAVYFPILLMLLTLVFRGVAFEFRFKHVRLRRLWDGAFCGGSLVATFAQGVVLGSFIQGFKVEGRVFAGSSFDFATPFALLTGVALVFGYGLLGAGWLVMKTDGPLQAWSRRAGRVCLIAVSCCIAAVSVWTPLASSVIAQRWFGWPNTALLLPLPLASLAVGLYAWHALGKDGAWQAFAASVALFALSFVGVAVSLWPMIVPGHFHALASRFAREHAGLPAGGHAGAAAGHPVLHRVVVLGVPRRSARARATTPPDRRPWVVSDPVGRGASVGITAPV